MQHETMITPASQVHSIPFQLPYYSLYPNPVLYQYHSLATEIPEAALRVVSTAMADVTPLSVDVLLDPN